MENKKGLSTIVTTLIVILLTLVAVGIVWAVISGVLKTGVSTVDTDSECLKIDLKASNVNCVTFGSNSNCSVKITRSPGGITFAGLKVIFKSNSVSSSVTDVPGNIAELGSATVQVNSIGANDTNKVEITPYFKEGSVETLCKVTTDLSY